jgi:ABC-type antimicrobial peptide transport system permease subunit
MQVAQSTSNPVGSLLDVVLAAPALLLLVLVPVAVVGVLVDAMVATDGAVEPPQPASAIEAQAASSASPPNRQYLVALTSLSVS